MAGQLCPACLLRLAVPDEDEGLPAGPLASSLSCRILGVIDSVGARTTYLAEREDQAGYVTVEVTPAAAVPGLTPEMFAARVADLRGLRHRGIARTLDGRMTEAGDFCVIAEFVAGQPLALDGFLRQMTASERLRVFDELCEACSHLHARRVFHGRLDPRSVLLVPGASGRSPLLTGFDIRTAASACADDIAGLAVVLAAIAAAAPEAAALGDLARRASGQDGDAGLATIDALRALAASGLASQNR